MAKPAKATSGSIIPSIAETLLTATEERRTDSAVKALVEPVIAPVAAEQQRVRARAGVVLQVAVREHAPVAAVPGPGPVAAELELGRAVAGLPLGPVAVVLAPDHRRVPLEVLLKTRSATAARHRDQARFLMAEEHLAAAAAGTTREQAAAEAATAWAAAVTAAVATAVAVAPE
ncbi:MAG TPA: hypothetical protein VE131_05355 [Terriglobales bacterium]|nr:hypothetical protein [Terriglobales bacterium]